MEVYWDTKKYLTFFAMCMGEQNYSDITYETFVKKDNRIIVFLACGLSICIPVL